MTAMKKKVIITDRMQRGYVYWRTEPVGGNFAPGFTPDLTPKQMLRLGVFGVKYMTDCQDEFPRNWLAHPHHHVGAGPKLCRSSREGPVPLLVAQSHISGRWPAHGDGGSRVLHTAARALRAAGESRLHPLDTQGDLSVSRRRDPPQIRSVVTRAAA